jgi:hypothetical protein
VRTAWRTHSPLITGSMPGMAASTSETCELGAPPKAVDAPEKSLALEDTWACTSMPMTTSHSPFAPWISLLVCALTFCRLLKWAPRRHAPRRIAAVSCQCIAKPPAPLRRLQHAVGN